MGREEPVGQAAADAPSICYGRCRVLIRQSCYRSTRQGFVHGWMAVCASLLSLVLVQIAESNDRCESLAVPARADATSCVC